MGAGATTGGDVIKSGVQAFLLAAGIALYVLFRESNSPETRRRSVRIWTWGIVAFIGGAAVIAMIYGGFMLGTGTTYN